MYDCFFLNGCSWRTYRASVAVINVKTYWFLAIIGEVPQDLLGGVSDCGTRVLFGNPPPISKMATSEPLINELYAITVRFLQYLEDDAFP